MRANYRMQRLFVKSDLSAGNPFEAEPEQFNYLANVLRLGEGAEILVFNGRDGEWLTRLTFPTRKKIALDPIEKVRQQTAASPVILLFAPLKVGRMDYLIQKAVEMGAGLLQPVMTQHVQGRLGSLDRLRANAIEAAEQCGILSIPEIAAPQRLADLIDRWPGGRRLIFCDEDSATDNPLPALQALAEKRGEPIALLVGPEGGFSEDERTLLRGRDFVTAIPLGPRILRADTAAVAALALTQATLGDWR